MRHKLTTIVVTTIALLTMFPQHAKADPCLFNVTWDFTGAVPDCVTLIWTDGTATGSTAPAGLQGGALYGNRSENTTDGIARAGFDIDIEGTFLGGEFTFFYNGTNSPLAPSPAFIQASIIYASGGSSFKQAYINEILNYPGSWSLNPPFPGSGTIPLDHPLLFGDDVGESITGIVVNSTVYRRSGGSNVLAVNSFSAISDVFVDVGVEPPPPVVRPFLAEDEGSGAFYELTGTAPNENPFPTIIGWGQGTVYATGASERAPIHAATSGLIYNYYPVTTDICKNVSGVWCVITYDDGSETAIITEELQDTYVVELLGDDSNIYSYLAYNADDYVTQGATVLQSCVLGEAVRSDPGDNYQTLIYTEEFTTGNSVSIIGDLTPYPTTSFPCVDVDADQDLEEFAGCISTSPYLNDETWSATGEVAFVNEANYLRASDPIPGTNAYQIEEGGGAYLNPQGAVSQTFQGLDSAQAYTITLTAQGEGDLIVSLGNASQTVAVNTTDYLRMIHVQLTPSPAGVMHPLRIQAAGDNRDTIRLFYAALCEYTAGNGEPSSQCFFANNSFNNGLMGWNYSASGLTVDNDTNLQMLDGSYFEQFVYLHPFDESTPQDYIITVEFASLTDTAPPTANLSYTWNGNASSWSIPDVDYFDLDTQAARVSDTITVSEAGGGAFRFTAMLQEANSNPSTTAAVLRSVCLRPEEGGNFPGHFNLYEAYEDDLPECRPNPRPTASPLNVGEFVGQWINYLTISIRNLFECTLIPTMTRIGDVLSNTLSAVISMGDYFSSATSYLTTWVQTDALAYIGGLFDQLINHPALNQFINQWITLFGVAYDLAASMLSFLWQFIQDVTRLITEVFSNTEMVRTTWQNAPPTSLPGALSCDTVQSGNVWCHFVVITDNTILRDGEPGTLTLNLLLAIGYFHVIIYVINRTSKTAQDVAGD